MTDEEKARAKAKRAEYNKEYYRKHKKEIAEKWANMPKAAKELIKLREYMRREQDPTYKDRMREYSKAYAERQKAKREAARAEERRKRYEE